MKGNDTVLHTHKHTPTQTDTGQASKKREGRGERLQESSHESHIVLKSLVYISETKSFTTFTISGIYQVDLCCHCLLIF